MDWEHVRGNWSEMSMRIRERWVELDMQDTDFIAGSREILITRLMLRYQMNHYQAEAQVRKWEHGLKIPDLQR